MTFTSEMKKPDILKLGLFIFMLLLLSGCGTISGRAYNLETGEISVAIFKVGTGRGKVDAVMPDGTKLHGEYSTIVPSSFSHGIGISQSPYGWAVAQGFSFNSSGVQYGTATLVGEGIVVEILYQVDAWSQTGIGVGRDNKGNKYRIQIGGRPTEEDKKRIYGDA